MADAPVTGSVVSSPTSKSKKGKSAVPSKKPTHPPTSDMVNSAISTLQERNGSSLQAIKKYISANYIVDADKISQFIKKYLKTAVINGGLVQTKGKGASGSFKLPSDKSKSAAKKSSTKTVKADEKKPKAKKAASPAKKKKPAAKSGEKKPSVAKSAKAPKAPKEKSTKPKSAAKKPKTPKPKKASPVKKVATKKAAAPKKK